MTIVQAYETEIADQQNGFAVRFVSVPRLSLNDPRLMEYPEDVLRNLELERVSDQIPASLVSVALASILQRDNDPRGAVEHFELVLHHRIEFENHHPELARFSEYATYADVLPVQESPLSAASLGNILASGSGVGVGAAAAFMAAGGPTPFLFVTVPLGIILCCSAKGIGEGLSEGLRYKIRKLMGVPEETGQAKAEPVPA